jgi:hypothetical protein
MAQELLCDRRFPCRDFARRERRYSLLRASEFFCMCSKDLAQTSVAGAKPAASYQECGQLDSPGRAFWHTASAYFISPHRTRWTSDPQRSPRNKSVQPSSSFLLIFLRLRCPGILLPMNSASSCNEGLWVLRAAGVKPGRQL